MQTPWWLIWLGVALGAGVAEIFTLALVFAMVAGGAVVAAVVAGVTGRWDLSVLAFAVGTATLLIGVRPPLTRYARGSGPATPVGIEALIGRRAEVLSPVTASDGRVKLAGEVWTARTRVPGESLEIGSIVYVVQIDGATAVVEPLPPDQPVRPTSPSDRPEM
jgi:membrane protein implicated in regulation of membrane protease activity